MMMKQVSFPLQTSFLAFVAVLMCGCGPAFQVNQPPSLGATHEAVQASSLSISAPVLGSTLQIGVSRRNAGSVDSLIWKGKEFIDADDRGRELQSASTLNGLGECLNPTEAGGSYDRSGEPTTSEILSWSNSSNVLRTSTRMAYWLSPGYNYNGPCTTYTNVSTAQNTTRLSNHVLNKTVSIGFEGLENVATFDIEYQVPEAYQSAGFEILTGYMPAEFSRFQTVDLVSGTLSDFPDRTYLTALDPVIFSTSDGEYAMGAYCPDLFDEKYDNASYGAFSFAPDTVKWNCGVAIGAHLGVPAGSYKFRIFVAIGSVAEVKSALLALHAKSASRANRVLESIEPDVFQVATYKTLNSDLSSMTDIQARAHWIRYGRFEGRQASVAFNARDYLARYSDVRAALGNDYAAALTHFVQHGRAEGRSSSNYFDPIVFNESFYRSASADLQSMSTAALQQHWLSFGMSEGRQAHPSFSVRSYLARYADLGASFGTDFRAAIDHYVTSGRAEGRSGQVVP